MYYSSNKAVEHKGSYRFTEDKIKAREDIDTGAHAENWITTLNEPSPGATDNGSNAPLGFIQPSSFLFLILPHIHGGLSFSVSHTSHQPLTMHGLFHLHSVSMRKQNKTKRKTHKERSKKQEKVKETDVSVVCGGQADEKRNNKLNKCDSCTWQCVNCVCLFERQLETLGLAHHRTEKRNRRNF